MPEFKARLGSAAVHGVKAPKEVGQAYEVDSLQVGWSARTSARKRA